MTHTTHVPNLRKKRNEKQLKQAELAKKANTFLARIYQKSEHYQKRCLTQNSISRYETGCGVNNYPRIDRLLSLCAALDCTVQELDPEHSLVRFQAATETREDDGLYSVSRGGLPRALQEIYDNWSLLSDTHKNMLEMIVEELRKKKDEHDCEQAESA